MVLQYVLDPDAVRQHRSVVAFAHRFLVCFAFAFSALL
jgi:hypothetical protein